MQDRYLPKNHSGSLFVLFHMEIWIKRNQAVSLGIEKMEMFLILSQFYTCFFNTKRTKVFLNYGQVKQLNC